MEEQTWLERVNAEHRAEMPKGVDYAVPVTSIKPPDGMRAEWITWQPVGQCTECGSGVYLVAYSYKWRRKEPFTRFQHYNGSTHGPRDCEYTPYNAA